VRYVLVLDVGSGTDKLDTARGNVCIDLCRRPANRPPNFVCADAHHLPFSDSVFEKANLYEVIEHVESPIRCLREIHRVLKEEGSLKLTTPNVFHWRVILRQARGLPAVLSDTGHISCWSEAELSNVLTNTGFSDLRFEYATLPLVFTPHKTLDRIARRLLPPAVSEKNLIALCVKRLA
jgi:SAM-dependent methyltransferase